MLDVQLNTNSAINSLATTNSDIHQGELVDNQVVVDATPLPDWSDSAKELLESLPQAWTRGLLYLIVVFAAIAIPWAMLAKVDETGTGRGRLEPKGSLNRLESAIAGTVVAVRAKEGDIVQQNQVLLELDSDKVRSELQQAQTKLEGQRNRLAQLMISKNQSAIAINTQQQQNQSQVLEKAAQTEQSRQNLADKESSTPLLLSSKAAQIAQAEKSVGDSKSNLLIQQAEKSAQVNQASEKLNGAKDAYSKIESRLQRNAREVKRYQSLAQQGVVSQAKVLEIEEVFNETDRLRAQAMADIKLSEETLKEQKINYNKVIEQLQADIQRNEFLVQEQKREYQKLQKQQGADVTQATIRLREQEAGQKSLKSSGQLTLVKSREQLNEIQTQIGTAETEIIQSQNQIKSLQRELEQKLLRAPTDGILVQLPVKQAQAFVQTGQLVAQIAPQDSKTIIKAQIPSQESGFLQAGMPVKVKFDAYPFQDYGVVTGKVQWISPDSKVVETKGIKTEIFELDVLLDRDYLQNRENRVNLSLGQTATIEIITRQRHIIDFILDPFKQLQQGGLKL